MKYGANIESGFYSGISNYFSDSLSIEKAILQRPVILPPVSEEYIDHNTLEAYSNIGQQYLLPDQVYTDVKANFYLPLIFPMVENGESTVMIHDAPNIENIYSIGSMESSEFKETNYVPLIIPKYIVMNFRDEIPVGTEFIVNFTGGTLNYANIHIMGVGNIGKESVFEDWYKSKHRMATWGDIVSGSGADPEDEYYYEIICEHLRNRISERNEYFAKLQRECYYNDDET